jgi:hypothetical protein
VGEQDVIDIEVVAPVCMHTPSGIRLSLVTGAMLAQVDAVM